MKTLKTLSFITSAIALTACGSHQIKSPDEYTKQSIEKASIFPSKEQLSGNPPRVVVFPAETPIDLAKTANLPSSVSKSVEEAVSDTKAQLIDRSKASKLGKELLLAEAKGLTAYKGENVADFAIIPYISEATFSKSFQEAYTWKDKEGKSHYVPAKCTFKSDVSGYIDVFEMPSLKAAARIKMHGDAANSHDTRNSRCPASQNDINALVSSASQEAVKGEKTKIKNTFPPKGYVVELRSNADGHLILKTTLGTNLGATEKAKVLITEKRIDKNDLTGKEDLTVTEIGKGVVSNQIQSDYSWIVLDKKNTQLGQISLGDAVTIEYKDNIFQKAFNNL